MKKLIMTFLVICTIAGAQEVKPWGSNWYWASVAATAGGSAFDAATSVDLNKYASPTGLHEANPLLANSQGQFDPHRGIAAKIIVLTTTIASERAVLYLLRKRGVPTGRVEKIFSWVNVGFGAGYTGIAVHNLALR